MLEYGDEKIVAAQNYSKMLVPGNASVLIR